MNPTRSFSVLLALLAAALPAAAQTSWLDRPLENWNRPAAALPQLPKPAAAQGDSASRCRGQVRKPAGAAEKALARRGWLLYGPVYSYDATTIVTALSGFDGMCRPLGFNAFVHWSGRYAGTLSPLTMDSRQDGALTTIHLGGPDHFSAEFARYRPDDPLCCPSRVDHVSYTLRRDDIPTLSAAQVTRTTACTAPPSPR
jgi:hypothetical protein